MQTSAKAETQTKKPVNLRMQLMRGTQQCSPLPRDSADRGGAAGGGVRISFANRGRHCCVSGS